MWSAARNRAVDVDLGVKRKIFDEGGRRHRRPVDDCSAGCLKTCSRSGIADIAFKHVKAVSAMHLIL